MKRSIFLFLSAICFFLSSCGPVITFNQPQPSWAPNKKEFPKNYRGQYLAPIDSSKLIINNKMVVYNYIKINTIPKVALDTLDGVRLHNGFIYGLDKMYNKPIPYIIKGGDSIRYFIDNVDTLFKIAKKNFLRQYKGIYYLNKQLYRRDWKVSRLNFNKQGQLMLSEVSEKKDLPKLIIDKHVEEVKSDSGNVLIYRIKLNRRQFKQFVKNNGFSNIKTFNRTN